MSGTANSMTAVACILIDIDDSERVTTWLEGACQAKCPVALFIKASRSTDPDVTSESQNPPKFSMILTSPVNIMQYLIDNKFREAMLMQAEQYITSSDPAERLLAMNLYSEVTDLFCDGYAAYRLGMCILDQTFGGSYWATRCSRVVERQPAGTPVDVQKAEEYFTKAVERGHVPEAYFGLAACFIEKGKSPELYRYKPKIDLIRVKGKNREYIKQCGEEAVRYLQLSDDKKRLAYIFQRGEFFLEKDERRAALLFETLALENDGESMYQLSECYLHGKGMEKDIRKAAEWRLKIGNKNYEPSVETKVKFSWQ